MINEQTILMLRDPLAILYDNMQSKIGEPIDLKEAID